MVSYYTKKTLIFIMPSCNLIYIICAIELHCCPRTLINTAVSPTTVYFKSAASTPPCCCKYPKEFQMSLIQSWKWSQKCFLFSISKLPPAVLVNYKVLHKDEAMNLWAPQLRKSKKKRLFFSPLMGLTEEWKWKKVWNNTTFINQLIHPHTLTTE